MPFCYLADNLLKREFITEMSSKSWSLQCTWFEGHKMLSTHERTEKTSQNKGPIVVANWLILPHDVGGYGILFKWDTK